MSDKAMTVDAIKQRRDELQDEFTRQLNEGIQRFVTDTSVNPHVTLLETDIEIWGGTKRVTVYALQVEVRL